jgi:Na+/melibiose symporter-like transporter
MANFVVLSVFLFCLCRAVGVAAHVPWLSAILPIAQRGRYWATEASITSAVGVVTLLTCTALFASLDSYSAFRAAYGIALVGSTMAVLSLMQLPDGPRPRPFRIHTLVGESAGLCLRPGLFRHYLVFSLLGAVVNSSFGAFSTYYLKAEVGLASSDILSLAAVTFGGQILGAWAIRRGLDRVMIRRFFQVANLILLPVFLFWLRAVLGGTPPLAAFVVASFATGVALGIMNTAHMTFVPEIAPVDDRPVAIAVFGAVSGIAGGLSPMLWGLALRPESGQTGVDGSNFAVFFGLGASISLGVALLIDRLPDPRIDSQGSQP